MSLGEFVRRTYSVSQQGIVVRYLAQAFGSGNRRAQALRTGSGNLP